MRIVDKFNEVGNNFAISSGGIGSALERSASSLSAANNSLDQSIALITAANTVVQDPEAVGTAFKTISMRIRGAKTELEEAGLETDGMAESTAKLRQEIQALSGVDIMQDENTFKSTYDIMDELSKKWQSLTDIQRASITELIGGKRQGNIISSLMTQFNIARKALQTSANSEGSATREHEKWLESMEAKTQQFQATWEGLSQDLMDDSFLKGLVDTGTNLLSVIDGIVDGVGALPVLLTTISGIMSGWKNIGRDKSFSL
jgi:TP901 family phage tail tape measure protein